MKIACVDRTAADRLSLQHFIDGIFDECRDTIGHQCLAHTTPVALTELPGRSTFDLIAIGPGYSPDEAHDASEAAKKHLPQVPLVAFVQPDRLTLSTIRRLSTLASEVFSTAEPIPRLMHHLSRIGTHARASSPGKVITVDGVKGGVGVTSIVSALAHAAHAIGRRSVVLDLSADGALAHFLLSSCWVSSDYAAALGQHLRPDLSFIERNLITCECGIEIFPAPSNSASVRERWLRDHDVLDLSLGVIELLLSHVDLVIVDLSRVEGVLPYALHRRADSRITVTSTAPESLHLLTLRQGGERFSSTSEKDVLVINEVHSSGLSLEDAQSFLMSQSSFTGSPVRLFTLEFQKGGAQWIGSGNSFYTESSRSTQRWFDNFLRTIARLDLPTSELPEYDPDVQHPPSLKRRVVELGRRAWGVFEQLKYLPRGSNPPPSGSPRETLPFLEESRALPPLTPPPLANIDRGNVGNTTTSLFCTPQPIEEHRL